MAKPIHVVPHGDQWAWRREGSSRVSGITKTQTAAVSQSRPASVRDGVELIIHRPNGQIHDKDSHGRDPHPPRG